jgi:hypothetical protein
VVLVLGFAPAYRLLDTSGEVPFRQVSVEVADSMLQLAWWGTIVTVLLSALLALLFSADRLRAAARSFAARLCRPSNGFYAAALAAVGTALATLVAYGLYKGLLTNVDEFAYTLHARYLAHGLLAGPTFSVPEFWLIPNTLVVPEGWVSQYPPTHLVALALMQRLGVPRLLGPLAFGAMVGLVASSMMRMMPERPAEARVVGLLVAVCPFLLFLGGTLMSHVTTGAFAAAALYAALRARDGGAGWAAVAGTAVGLTVADRPIVGLVLGAVFTVGVWVPTMLRTRPVSLPWLVARLVGAAAGGLPVAVLLGWYNLLLFGAPLRLGYLAAFGERHRLGFHVDPWGSHYGLSEALAFTSNDILAAGVQLLETPYPATALVGIAFLTGVRMSRGMGLLLAWAFLPVLANGYYWFHNARMLFEAAPAWVALAVLAAAHLAGSGDAAEQRKLIAVGRDLCAWAVAVGIVYAVGWNIPSRWASYAWRQETLDRITAPFPPPGEPSIVFVHTSWNERLSSTLQGAGGMRQDSVITALRRNTNCGLYLYSVARKTRLRGRADVSLPPVDLTQDAGSPEDIYRMRLRSGMSLRVRAGEAFPEACRREQRADRLGTVALAPLLWQGDLPGIEEGRPLFVRDLGPEENRLLLEHYSKRVAFAFVPTSVGAAPELLPYDEAMELLWGDASSAPGQPP